MPLSRNLLPAAALAVMALAAPAAGQTPPPLPPGGDGGPPPLPGAGAGAAPDAPVGAWYCVINSPAVSVQLQVQVSPDRSLMAEGTLNYVGTAKIYKLSGRGDWSVLPPEPGAGYMFKFRMFPSNHPIVTWFVRPTGTPGMLYNKFQEAGSGRVMETACQKTG